jgi:acetolactate synthase I/II/III large subunit
MYTASTAFLEALNEAGVSYIFANLGSDHPSIVEAIEEAKVFGRKAPQLVTCPHEMVAMSAAHGHALVSGKAQAVLVHVECGTQSLAGAVHNASKGRVPILVFAGSSPFTQDGEMRGSRNEFIQWIQDVSDQRGIVRNYMKYDNEVRTGKNIKQLVHRALQFAQSDPKGPAYLMGAREVMEEELATPVTIDIEDWQPIAPSALPPDALAPILDAFSRAKRAVVITSYLGRNQAAVGELVRFCDRLGIGVLESVPSAMNFPHDNPLYQGNQWNHPQQNPVLAEADVILVIDSDVPWIPTVSRPRNDALIFHIDVDPLKERMPLWYIAAKRVFRADANTALQQLNVALEALKLNPTLVGERRKHYGILHILRQGGLAIVERSNGVHPSGEYLTACVRKHVDENTIALNEGITNYPAIHDHLGMSKPGSIFASGGGSLGWNGGAAIGAKLAAPDKTIMALTGDGSYMFSVPSTVHWMARQYRTPFLQVIYNNRGWKAPKFSTLAVHPDGFASRANDIGVAFDPPPDYSAIAAASGGAFARKVERAEDVEDALEEAITVVRSEGQAAVLDVWLPHL